MHVTRRTSDVLFFHALAAHSSMNLLPPARCLVGPGPGLLRLKGQEAPKRYRYRHLQQLQLLLRAEVRWNARETQTDGADVRTLLKLFTLM